MNNCYTYLIGWSALNKWYYGVRYAKKSLPSDLWSTYFTSSKHVKEFRQNYGEPDIIQIRKQFTCADSACEWEYRVLCKLGVLDSDKWLNKTTNKAISREAGILGSTIAANLKRGIPHSAEHSAKISTSLTGKHRPDSVKNKMSITRKQKSANGTLGTCKGISKSIEHKTALSKMAKERPMASCLCCKKCCNMINFNRWHGEKCKPRARSILKGQI